MRSPAHLQRAAVTTLSTRAFGGCSPSAHEVDGLSQRPDEHRRRARVPAREAGDARWELRRQHAARAQTADERIIRAVRFAARMDLDGALGAPWTLRWMTGAVSVSVFGGVSAHARGVSSRATYLSTGGTPPADAAAPSVTRVSACTRHVVFVRHCGCPCA